MIKLGYFLGKIIAKVKGCSSEPWAVKSPKWKECQVNRSVFFYYICSVVFKWSMFITSHDKLMELMLQLMEWNVNLEPDGKLASLKKEWNYVIFIVFLMDGVDIL